MGINAAKNPPAAYRYQSRLNRGSHKTAVINAKKTALNLINERSVHLRFFNFIICPFVKVHKMILDIWIY